MTMKMMIPGKSDKFKHFNGAPKRYAVQIIQCMARSDIYEGRYDLYLGGVLSVWIWSVPRDQPPIYQGDSWRCVRWGTSALLCTHSNH